MYFGSVRFFKNMILLAVIVLIAVPVAFAISLRVSLSAEQAQAEHLQQELETAQQELETAQQELEATQRELEQLIDQANQSQTPGGPDSEQLSEPIAYQTLYPDFYAPEEYHATQRTPGTIYLAFDDGPSENTARILDILDEYGVKATFFVNGREDEASYGLLREIVARGHTLGMHSYTHNYRQVYDSVDAFLEDMYRNFCQIKEVTGVTPVVFRFPGGSINSYNAGIYQELLAEMIRRGFVPYDWNLSAEDAVVVPPSSAQIVESIVGAAGRVERGFVLLHDSAANDSTVEALGTIIEQLRDMGFQFDRLTPETKPVLFGYKDQ